MVPIAVLACLSAIISNNRNNHNVRIARNYRSILGDPAMKWKPTTQEKGEQRETAAAAAAATHGPRMQFFMYGLCSKALPANFR